jgi:hypothetical protein
VFLIEGQMTTGSGPRLLQRGPVRSPRSRSEIELTVVDSGIGISTRQSKKDDPAYVARVGLDAMMRGDGDVVSGWKNKLQSAIAIVTPAGVLAEQHRQMAEPGSGQKKGA